MRAVGKSTSCRGVAFESNCDRLRLTAPPSFSQNGQSGRWVWIPRSQSKVFSNVIPFDNYLERTMSRSSSHFCDLDFTDVAVADEENRLQELVENEEPCQLEKQNKVGDVEKQDQTPKAKPAKPGKVSRLSIILLDQGLFTVYKRLFMVSLTLNILALILSATGHFPYGKRNPALFAIGNILALSLCRSEAFLRVVFLAGSEIIWQAMGSSISQNCDHIISPERWRNSQWLWCLLYSLASLRHCIVV